MPESLVALERQRKAILARILDLGDFRSGSISAVSGRCGKPSCRCHQPGQPAHGPNYRLTRKVNGKTVSETFSSPAQRRKAQREVFSPLPGAEPTTARSQRTDLPLAPRRRGRRAESAGKKTAEAIQQEVAVEVGRLLRVVLCERRKRGSLDLEAVEQATRDALHQAGAVLLETLLNEDAAGESQQPCACGSPARYAGRRPKKLVTMLGKVVVERPYYHCSRCGKGFAPHDQELAVKATQYSPGVRRMTALVGSETSFDRGRALLDELAGVRLTAKAVEREAEAIGEDVASEEQAAIARAVPLELPAMSGPETPILYIEMDGTGVPVTAAETAGRKGKDGGPAGTREVKLGCVFTQTSCDEQGRPVRDEDSTSYTGAIEDAAAFGRRIYSEAWRRGWSRARSLATGSNLSHEYFPGAIEIVDLYHAREHLWELASKLFPQQQKRLRGWARRMQKKLDAGRIEQLVTALREIETDDPELAHPLALEADYFQRHAERMRYGEFRRQGLFVGSGVIEAGCRTVIASRLKRSGMFWSVRGANAITALRCARLSNRFDDYWENRARAA